MAKEKGKGKATEGDLPTPPARFPVIKLQSGRKGRVPSPEVKNHGKE